MSLDAVVVEVALTQPMLLQLDAAARAAGVSREVELRHAVEHYVAWSHDRGELRDPRDVATDFPEHLPSDGELL